jgi:hypothetical protein
MGRIWLTLYAVHLPICIDELEVRLADFCVSFRLPSAGPRLTDSEYRYLVQYRFPPYTLNRTGNLSHFIFTFRYEFQFDLFFRMESHTLQIIEIGITEVRTSLL